MKAAIDDNLLVRETGAHDNQAFFSELDRALAGWARRHGAEPLVAQAFALASWAVQQGHSCLDLTQIPTQLMQADKQSQLGEALRASELVGTPDAIRPLIVEANHLYLQRYHAYETQLAERLRQLLAKQPQPVDASALCPGNGLFDADPQHPDATNWQAVAAFVALRQHFAIISGGPGTGKTFSIARLLALLVGNAPQAGQSPPLVALAAPTGKAAARMAESVHDGLAGIADAAAVHAHIPQQSHTLHRLLGLTGNTTQARYSRDNPLPHDVVIVDEASMVDLPMMAKLAEAIRDDARLILLGDRYQLASVESGSVLAELCTGTGNNAFSAGQTQAAGDLLRETDTSVTPESPLADHVVTLQTSRRFNADSAIGQLAAAVNAGQADTVLQLLEADSDTLEWQAGEQPQTIDALIDRLAGHYAALHAATDPEQALALLQQHCILTAVRRGPAGSQTINARIRQELAQRLGFGLSANWYHGRPVMITRNSRRIGLHNGDLGIVLDDAQGQRRVWFAGPDAPRAFLPNTLPEHASAYAMTIHKSQGSEFDAVSLVLPDYDVPILTRELLYTGLTRAKNRLIIYACRASLQQSVARRSTRHAGLARKLGNP